MKMESVEFYAELLYKSKMLGGPKEFDKNTIEKLYEIRRKWDFPESIRLTCVQNKGQEELPQLRQRLRFRILTRACFQRSERRNGC